MKYENPFSRRNLFKVSALLAGGSVLGFRRADVRPLVAAKTPPLSATEIAAIEAAVGKKGSYKEAEATYTIPFPRNDLKINIHDEPVPVPLGFGGWMSIKKTLDAKAAVLMSDCVLLQTEVNTLISAAQAAGLEIGAIHNHFFYEEPRVFYMHVHGMGTPEDLARKYAQAISQTKIAPANQPPAGSAPSRTGKDIFDLSQLDKIIGYEAVVNGPTIKYTIGRKDLTVIAMGAEMTASIGLNTWASFAGTMEKARVAGDVAMLEHEVNHVIRILRAGGIEVVAVHNHMLGDQPRIIFLHYLGTGPALELGKTFKAALDVLGNKKIRESGMAGMHNM